MRTRDFIFLGVLLAGVSCASNAESTTTSESGDTTTLAEEPTTTAPTIEETTTSAAGEAVAGEDPCVLVPAETVASIFVATSASAAPGIARQCTFTLVDGLVPTVEVFHYGSSTNWEEVRAGFEENRSGVTEVPGVGEDAFQPNDAAPYEIVVRYLDIIYSVAVFSGGGPEVEAAILELASAIAGG
ncbi:MAG: hypothetical protein K0T01_1574 [Acidimicrobiia bacterium]|nr:hypothetical protein [Acidimicrobiia bacterium]